MGFEYKNDLKELLPEYLDYLVSKGEIEERGDGFYTCPFCNSGNKQKNTAAFHVNGTRYQCFSFFEHRVLRELDTHSKNRDF